MRASYFKELLKPYRRYFLFKCIYKDKEKTKILKEIADNYENHLGTIHTEDECVTMAKIALEEFIREYGCIFKHQSFYEEEEWRIVIQDPEEILFRNGTYGLTPYCKLPIQKIFYKKSRVIDTTKVSKIGDINERFEFFIGPTSDFLKSERALRLLLQKNNIDMDLLFSSGKMHKIFHSDIPLR